MYTFSYHEWSWNELALAAEWKIKTKILNAAPWTGDRANGTRRLQFTIVGTINHLSCIGTCDVNKPNDNLMYRKSVPEFCVGFCHQNEINERFKGEIKYFDWFHLCSMWFNSDIDKLVEYSFFFFEFLFIA